MKIISRIISDIMPRVMHAFGEKLMVDAGTLKTEKYAGDKKPNILWICSDQQRSDTLGCYGNTWVQTPHLDALADQGVLFEHAICQNPLCTPSRGSFLTGRYPSTNRLRQNGQLCPDDLRILPRMLKDNGYVCGLSGKLHLSNCDARFTETGTRDEWWQYDHKYFFNGTEKRIDDGYDEFYWNHAPGTGENQYSSDYNMWVHERGGSITYPQVDGCKSVVQGMPDELHQTRWASDRCINFMERHGEAHYPWMFSLNIFDPHPHFDPEPSYLQRYMDKLDDIPLPNYIDGENESKPAHHHSVHGFMKEDGWSDYDKKMMRAAYWACCDHIDFHVGRVMQALEDSGQRENTIVIYTSDHGELLGDHGKLPKGPFLYDCSVQVPLIISWPKKFKAGLRVKGVVELCDIVPTINDILELGEEKRMQGQSLNDVLEGTADSDHVRDEAYCEFHNSHGNDKTYLTMIRTDTHKIIVAHTSREGELYDLVSDPGEHVNQWDNPDYADIKMELLTRLTHRMAFTCDPLPERVGLY